MAQKLEILICFPVCRRQSSNQLKADVFGKVKGLIHSRHLFYQLNELTSSFCLTIWLSHGPSGDQWMVNQFAYHMQNTNETSRAIKNLQELQRGYREMLRVSRATKSFRVYQELLRASKGCFKSYQELLRATKSCQELLRVTIRPTIKHLEVPRTVKS